MLLQIIFHSCFYSFTPVYSQWCSRKYRECSRMSPCCSGLDILICLPATNSKSYCYPQSEYLEFLSQQLNTTPTTSPATTSITGKQQCAGGYQSCEAMVCCLDSMFPKVCVPTPSGKFCVDESLRPTTTTTWHPLMLL
ncbi:cell wall protein DAN4 [Biomphalaria glabrata]|nr:cell wall protein DAN4-like [Biomphalaria glabrata]